MESMRRRLSGNSNEWGVIHIGIRDTRDEIRCAWPQGSNTNTGITCKSTINIGHKSRPLFMASGNKLDR